MITYFDLKYNFALKVYKILDIFSDYIYNVITANQFNVIYALVAQLDRASPSDGEGCGFDSRRVRQQLPDRF